MTREEIIQHLKRLSTGVGGAVDGVVGRALRGAVVLLEEVDGASGGGAETLEERNRAAGRPRRSSSRWRPDEEATLRAGLVEGAQLVAIAEELERSPGALVGRLQHLGVLQAFDRLLSYQEISERARERLVAGSGEEV